MFYIPEDFPLEDVTCCGLASRRLAKGKICHYPMERGKLDLTRIAASAANAAMQYRAGLVLPVRSDIVPTMSGLTIPPS